MIYLNDHIATLDVESMLPMLSEQRRQQAMAIRHELGRQQCVAAYLLLRTALDYEFGIAERPTFEYGEHGKPTIAGYPDIHFNLSHCRTAAICIVGTQPIGIDIETVRPYKESLAQHTMNEAELSLINRSERPDVAFTRLWTKKEAVVKLTGTGIRTDMRNILSAEQPTETVVIEEKELVYSVAFPKNYLSLQQLLTLKTI